MSEQPLMLAAYAIFWGLCWERLFQLPINYRLGDEIVETWRALWVEQQEAGGE